MSWTGVRRLYSEMKCVASSIYPFYGVHTLLMRMWALRNLAVDRDARARYIGLRFQIVQRAYFLEHF